MKFINYLQSMTGVGIYPLISLIIFFVFFMGVGFYVVKGSKAYFNTLSNLPLNNDSSNANSNNHDNAGK